MPGSVLLYLIWSVIYVLLIGATMADILKDRQDDPQRSALWLLLVATLPVPGILFYLLVGRTRRGSLGRRVADSAEDFRRNILKNPKMERYYNRLSLFSPDYASCPNPAAQHMLDRMLPETMPLAGNKARLLNDGTNAYPAMLKAIASAKKSIFLQSYIIADDEAGKTILAAMESRAREGVEVRVLYDRFGSFYAVLRKFFHRYGKGLPNFRICPFSLSSSLTAWRFQLRNHRKLLIVDSRVAFLGGINISSENIRKSSKSEKFIHDLHCRLEGPAVGELTIAFLRDWYYAARVPRDRIVNIAAEPECAKVGNDEVRVVASGWGQFFGGNEKVFHAAAASARKSLWIISPYFVPDREFLSALRMAAARGVDVRIVVPLLNNHFYVKFASRSLYASLLEAGVRIFERKNLFVHSKAMLVDSEWGMIGSSNCDVRSFRLNFELDIVVRGDDFSTGLLKQFAHEMAESEEITLRDTDEKPILHTLAENVFALMIPVL